MQKRTALIVGGTSGLGLELALLLVQSHQVIITGRHSPMIVGLSFEHLELTASTLPAELDALVERLSPVDLCIYAAGFYQEGALSELSDVQIADMFAVGLHAPALLVQRLLRRQGLSGFIVVTSTSQWTPRLLEPVYTAVKAGLGMLAHSLSLDGKVSKVLVVGPAGMKTPFWDNSTKDTSDMLDPVWVAEQTLELYRSDFEYLYARILRGPARVEVVERRV